ncbi:sensor histidine kinase [Brevibacillus sp. B_LB10_24]|uniref:sensor histidine kinase n=1 Tax=Brevibacillus sp. B_LB10_24 TaxID=3380645 RepID=UPI0038BCE394
MKLLHQLNLAFAVLLLFVIGVTAVLTNSLMMDSLVENQRMTMKEQGSAFLQQLNKERVSTSPIQALPVTNARPVSLVAPMDIVLIQPTQPSIKTEAKELVLYSTLSPSTTAQWVQNVKNNKETEKELWNGTNNEDKYIVETITQSTNNMTSQMILATSYRAVKEMQLALLKRILLILVLGGVAAWLLSVIITKKLVTPLIKLKEELKKVQERRFHEVELVKTGGEIGEVAKGVSQLASELDKYIRTQKEFFQNASHELKTPLMSIQGYAEGIRDGVFTDNQAQQGLEVIIHESKRLKRIVTEMTLLAKLESEEDIFHFSEIPIQHVILQTIERLKPLAEKKGLEIRAAFVPGEQTPMLVRIDQDKLLQALLNVVSNAIRHGKRIITINVMSAKKEIVIEVADDGEGIAESVLPRLFHRFVKGKDGETGLGLAISRAIIERCGGEIEACNRQKGGAVFQIRVPSTT